MIITKQKSLDYLVEKIENKPIFIVGCSECATLCKTGGEEEVIEMKKNLENKNIEVIGWAILEPACNLQNDKKILKAHREEIKRSGKIVVLACGNGAQVVRDAVEDIEVITGTDTIFLGEIKRLNDFERKCNLCGDCIQDIFGSHCPVSRCPKNMLNGPCGGSINGRCEINGIDCVWDLIIKHFRETNNLEKLKEIIPPKDWSKSNEMSWRI